MKSNALTTVLLVAMAGCVSEQGRGIPIDPPGPVLAHPDDSPLLRAESVSVAFRANGEICTKDGDCSTGNCTVQTETGERRCYGSHIANEPCLSAFDCAAGACAPTSWPPSESGPKACVPADIRCRARGLSDDCVELAYQTCAYGRACAGLTVNFNACVESACEDIWRQHPDSCHDRLTLPGASGCGN